MSQPGWADDLGVPFDRVLALAVLHHLPGCALRLAVLRQMAALLQPAGRLILSTWQFDRSERLRRKIVPWEQIGLTADQVEPGDYLLDWRRGGLGLRYCCLIGENELATLCHAAGLTLIETYFADNALNLYGIARLAA